MSAPAFHIAALCFTALWDPIRDSEEPCVTDLEAKKEIETVLRRLISLIRSFAIVYKVCRAHALYCIALRHKILDVLGLELPPQQLLVSSGCLSQAVKFVDQFEECAQIAGEAQSYWVQGLALLETKEVSNWFNARQCIFVRYQHAEYELARADKLLEPHNYILNEDQEENRS